MNKEKRIRRKALETFLSGRQISGAGTEENQKALSEKEKKEIESLIIPIGTKDLRIRGRKKGIKTPRQTFRCDESLWKQFIAACRKKESKSASEILRRFISRYVRG